MAPTEADVRRPESPPRGRRRARHCHPSGEVYSPASSSGSVEMGTELGRGRRRLGFTRAVPMEATQASGNKVDTGHGQAAKIVGGNDPSTLMPPPVENASNRAPIINSGATDGGLYPVASTNLEGLSVPSTNVGAEEVQPTAYTCPGQKGEDTGKKRQLSQMAMLLEVENYLELKMKQIRRLVEEVKEAPKQEDRFTIEKCVAALEAIEELTDVEKAKALKLFKCRLNREIFMNTKTASVRLIWLKREIDA